MSSREQFEAWFENDVVSEEVTFPVFEGGEYAEGELYDDQFYFMLQAMWMAWQAASKASERQLEESRREFRAADATIHNLELKVAAVVAENGQMLRLLTDISENHDEYVNADEYLYAGVPMDYVSEINAYVSRDVNAENPFPATDSILRAAEARGVEKFASDQREIAEHWKAKIGNTIWIERSIAIAEEAEAFAQYLRVVKA